MDLNQIVETEAAVLVLFGGAHCHVCQVIRPKLEAMLADQFPKVRLVYVDCAEQSALCAQQGVLSLPTVHVYFGGQKVGEWVRTFSLGQLSAAMARPYGILFDSDAG